MGEFIDISDKKEHKIPLGKTLMGEAILYAKELKDKGITDRVDDINLLSGLSKENIENDSFVRGIVNASNLKSKFESIDNSVSFYENNFAPERACIFDGTAHVELNSTYVIENDGDSIEFELKIDEDAQVYQESVGIFGIAETLNNTIGFLTNNNIGIRGETTKWMQIAHNTNKSSLNKYKLIVNGSNIDLYVNGKLEGSCPFLSPISISTIGNSYGSLKIKGQINSFSINTSNRSIESHRIHSDMNLTQHNTNEIIIPKTIEELMSNNIVVKYNGSNELIIFKPQVGEKYIAYTFKRDNTKIKSDNWRIYQAYEADKYFTLGIAITNSGEWETAIKIKDASDFMGGQAHGNETLTYFMALVDGKEIDLTSSFELSCNTLEFIQISNLTVPSVREANEGEVIENYPTEGSIAAVSTKRWVFNSKVENKLYQKVKWNTSLNIIDAYLFMIPIYRVSLGKQITHTSCVSDVYEKINNTEDGHSNPYYNGSNFGGTVRIWGDEFSAKVDILKGWKDTAHFNVSPSTLYNKLYFDFTGPYITEIDELMDVEIAFDVIKVAD